MRTVKKDNSPLNWQNRYERNATKTFAVIAAISILIYSTTFYPSEPKVLKVEELENFQILNAKIDSFNAAKEARKLATQKPAMPAAIAPKRDAAEKPKPRFRKQQKQESGKYDYRRKNRQNPILEINSATAQDFAMYRGIGAGRSAAIIKFRERLGGFYEIEQVGETYAVPDSVFQTFKEFLRCNRGVYRKINLNLATSREMGSHIYCSWKLANLLENYRRQHGKYESVKSSFAAVKYTSNTLIEEWKRFKNYLTIDD